MRDRQVDVETPEHVAIGYELADLGSRFTALLIDLFLISGSLLGVVLLLAALGTLDGVDSLLDGVGVALFFAVWFLLFWGYFLLFEGLRDGQTPGKRRMGIRVVHDGGFPVTIRGSAVRNLLRVIDIQPAPSWLVGGLAMMLHPHTKRLGDMAAGTVVVRDRTGELLPEETPPAPIALGPPRLGAEAYEAVAMYDARRATLAPEVRAKLARALTEQVWRHVEDDPRRGQLSPDALLGAIYREETQRRQGAGIGGRAGSAQATDLARRHRREWDEYRELLEGAQRRGLDRLGEARVSRFAALYRAVAADLARARTYGGSPPLLHTLERLVGAGHNLLYRPPARSWRRFGRWLAGGFPALVRHRWRPILLASALFYLPALLTFAGVRADPTLARELVPAEMMARAEEAAEKEARGEGYVEVDPVGMPALASQLVSNNVQVTFLAFAGGILAGLGTAWVLIFNGVHLGSVAGVFANYGQSLHLWTFVLPHGVIELTAICIAGGAGLWLGSALLLPGRRTRREALVVRGREAVSLIGGTAMMLLAAGVIEGFISPSALPREVKLALAALFAAALLAYLLFAGRGPAWREPTEAADRL